MTCGRWFGRVACGLALAGLLALSGCTSKRGEKRAGQPGRSTATVGALAGASAATTGTTGGAAPSGTAASRQAELTLIAGGDISLARTLGQRLLRGEHVDPFGGVAHWLGAAEVRFGNLESQLSDQGGETVHPTNPLIFTGPPSGAEVLAAAHFDVVSLANNHMWDYGKRALLETFANLERVGVSYVGAGRTRAGATKAWRIDRDGFHLALLAVTDIWNQGPLGSHPGREMVAGANPQRLAQAVRALAADTTIDAVVVSLHGGGEYQEQPVSRTRTLTHAAIDAGASVVIGHHPHVVQGIGWYRGRPILYSLGNFTMGMNGEHPWSEYGYLARITLRRGRPPRLAVCPYRLVGNRPEPLWTAGTRSAAHHFFRRLRYLSNHVAGSDIGPVADDGCATVRPPAQPYPGAIP